VKYGPAAQQYTKNLAQAGGLARDTGDWYAAYQKALQDHARNTAVIGAYGVGQLGQFSGALQGLDQSQLNQSQAAANQDASVRGAVAGNQGPDASNAAGVRQAGLAAQAGQLAGTSMANTRYADTLANVVAPGQRIQAGAQAAQGVTDAGQKLADLATQTGAYKQSYKADAIDAERKNVLENAAFGLKSDKAATTSAVKVAAQRTSAHDKAQNRKIKRSSLSLAQRKEQDAKDKDAYQRKHGLGPYKPGGSKAGKKGASSFGTPQQQRSTVSEVNKVVGLIKSSPKVDDQGHPLTDQVIRQHLLSGANPTGSPIDRRIVNIAFDLARKGGLSAPNVKSTHQLGVQVNGNFKVLGKTKAKKKVTAKARPTGGLAPVFDPTKNPFLQ
jgi:hypothetical protein